MVASHFKVWYDPDKGICIKFVKVNELSSVPTTANLIEDAYNPDTEQDIILPLVPEKRCFYHQDCRYYDTPCEQVSGDGNEV
jgi:hypothetical protein